MKTSTIQITRENEREFFVEISDGNGEFRKVCKDTSLKNCIKYIDKKIELEY
jgi:hypothetical protein